MTKAAARRWLKDFLKRQLLSVHKAFLRVGWHVAPAHFYLSQPNILQLKQTQNIWARPSDLPGIRCDMPDFVQALKRMCDPFKADYEGLPVWHEAISGGVGLSYGYIDAQCLHAVVRSLKPRNVIEVGSGLSTTIMLDALRRNGQGWQLTCIDPHPSQRLLRTEAVTVIRKPLQSIGIDTFRAMRKDDLLFVDSTHTVMTGSDVNYLILEVLPNLNAGVLVHFHDIYLPYDYSRDVLDTFFHWSETSLLRAFLINNSRASILFSLSMMHYDCPQVLREVFPEYVPEPDEKGLRTGSARAMESSRTEHFPCSTYIMIR